MGVLGAEKIAQRFFKLGKPRIVQGMQVYGGIRVRLGPFFFSCLDGKNS